MAAPTSIDWLSPPENSSTPTHSAPIQTRVLHLSPSDISATHTDSTLSHLQITIPPDSPTSGHLAHAAATLRTSNIPIAFPTETVYGLGADATRSAAVRGIFAAKNRPADNPLIVHICDLTQLRNLLTGTASTSDQAPTSPDPDPIPAIYHPLITRFWPGPLTILLPASPLLAPEVTAGLPTFGARMPGSPLALALIRASDLPLAAPSANASTRPSPTQASHVLHDLNGRIELILDGGDCEVGVESTVVDGLSVPPAVLRPGGVSLGEIREVQGWEGCVKGYRDVGDGKGEEENIAPRAPGMKYKHYAPSARVILVKAGMGGEELVDMVRRAAEKGLRRVGVLRGPRWERLSGRTSSRSTESRSRSSGNVEGIIATEKDAWDISNGADGQQMHLSKIELEISETSDGESIEIIDAALGRTAEAMARNLFRGLREMDLQKVDIIFVEGLCEDDGEESAAVTNRLKKAAEVQVGSLDELPF